MNLKINKKGQTLFWLIRIIIITMIIVTVHLLTSGVLAGEVNTYGMEYDILLTKMLNAVSYEDSLGRVHLYIIDSSKFNNATLKGAVGDAHGATIKATLMTEESNVSIYNSWELYDLYFPLIGYGEEPEGEFSYYDYLVNIQNLESRFKDSRTEYKLVAKSFIVHVDEDKRPARLHVNMIFPLREVAYR